MLCSLYRMLNRDSENTLYTRCIVCWTRTRKTHFMLAVLYVDMRLWQRYVLCIEITQPGLERDSENKLYVKWQILKRMDIHLHRNCVKAEAICVSLAPVWLVCLKGAVIVWSSARLLYQLLLQVISGVVSNGHVQNIQWWKFEYFNIVY